jgi:UDP-GlcNAc3NAcA epimerase
MYRSKSIVSIVGARPNFIKLAPIYRRLKGKVTHTIIHTGQHYDFEMSEIFFNEFNLPKPDFNLEIGSGTSCYQVGEMIKQTEKVIREHQFDLAIVYGDTNSTFAGAFAAFKSNIKIGHVEAGIRSFDRNMPEEINRVLTDNLSQYFFAPTDTAVENIKKANLSGQILQTGDLSVEILAEHLKMSKQSQILSILDLEPDSYILFTMHRAENTSQAENLLSVIKTMERINHIKIVFPIHPRTMSILKLNNLYERILACKNVKVTQPVGYTDFVQLMRNSTKIVTDSGGIQKESFLLSVPCITIRNNTEWVETIQEGWNILVGTDSEKIIRAIESWYPSGSNRKQIFGKGDTSRVISDKILDIIR